MRQVGAGDDDLKLLEAKGFVKVLNEDYVTYILEWRENNRLRADRKTDSIYRKLLLKVMPEVNLLGTKPRADVTPTKKASDDRQDDTPPSDGRPVDEQVPGQRQDVDGTVPADGPHRVVESRLGKGSVVEDSTGSGGMDGLNQFKSTQALVSAWKLKNDDPVLSQMAIYRQQVGEPLLNHSVQYMIGRRVTLGGMPKYLANMVGCWIDKNIKTPEEAEKYEMSYAQGPQNVPDTVPDIPMFKITD
ncbi:hypothetical protein [Levilactobacillus brevis]|uniref:hypothetical protein n=1 Tax=Levilactobacillus brevis TaxID=1580 RepID=UPI001183A6DE|nr:hypothetical protein [Levilactobacillus brevis]